MAKRYLMWVLIAFVLTLFLCTYLPFKTILISAAVLFVLGVTVLLIPFSLKQTVFSCAVSAILAVLLFLGMQHWVAARTHQLIDKSCSVRGQITEVGSNSAGDRIRYRLRLKEIEGESLAFYEHYSIYLYTDAEGGEVGDYLQGELNFFDTALDYGYGFEDRIFLSAYPDEENLTFEKSSENSILVLLANFRKNVQARISHGNDATVGLLKSVCFGDKHLLDKPLGVSLRRIGLSHVMAVSGLHLSFTVLLFNSLLLILGVHYRVRYIINIFVSIFFTALVGFPPSCVRACVMLVLYSLAMALGVFSDGLTSLSIAAFLLSLFNPLVVRDVGFLLSVLATAGIISLKVPIEHFLFPLRFNMSSWLNGIYRSFTGIISCSLAASIFTLPVLIATFGTVSILGPLANLILIFPLQWFFMLGILMVLLGWIPGVSVVIGYICDLLYLPIKWVSDSLGRLRYAEVSNFNRSGVIMIILLFLILGIALYHYLKYQKRSFIPLFMMFLILFGMVTTVASFSKETKSVKIAFIDVGQGDCTVISKDGTAVIFDYGGTSDKRYNLIDYLKENHIHTIELLAFTHLHADHTNGLGTLLKNVYVDQIIYPYALEGTPHLFSLIQSQNHALLREDTPIKVLDDLVIEPILDPSLNDIESNDNERCVCYRVTTGAVSVLITGDLQGRAELLLLDEKIDCTLLKVAHHGSKSSSLYPFLKAASAEIAVVSVGENKYDFPDQGVLKRLKSLCPHVYTTMDEGTLVFETDGTILERIA